MRKLLYHLERKLVHREWGRRIICALRCLRGETVIYRAELHLSKEIDVRGNGVIMSSSLYFPDKHVPPMAFS